MFRIIIAGAVLALGGCSHIAKNKNVKNDWQCEAEQGFGCTKITDIRKMIARPGEGPPAVVLGETPTLETNGAPTWIPDQIMKIHVADFVDHMGNYHKEHVIYTVVRHGGWSVEDSGAP